MVVSVVPVVRRRRLGDGGMWWCWRRWSVAAWVVVLAVGRRRLPEKWRRMTESVIVDRIDRVTGSTFGFAGKSPPEKFSGDGVVVAGGDGRLAGVISSFHDFLEKVAVSLLNHAQQEEHSFQVTLFHHINFVVSSELA
uniref:Uncharacterized protein n=1 Tax=Tanacetum cinerariifolium TaxID=118510 RepID=A0A6L2KLA8_TANCI|nr:hypothetical protein [Tanacetum cinerariifolium]